MLCIYIVIVAVSSLLFFYFDIGLQYYFKGLCNVFDLLYSILNLSQLPFQWQQASGLAAAAEELLVHLTRKLYT